MRYVLLSGLVTVASVALVTAFGAGTASATTMTVGGVAQNQSVTIEASLSAGESMVIRDTSSSFVDTCTSSTLKGKTEGSYTGETVGGNASSLTLGNCTHKTLVVKLGKFKFAYAWGIPYVYLEGFEFRMVSTTFGMEHTCSTGTGTPAGTFTGTQEGHAAMNINAVINCGFFVPSAKWEGRYIVTSPTGLGVTS